MVTAVAGAGGKTTLIHALAARHRAAGRRVLVTTTTHMRREPGMLLNPTPEQLTAALETAGYAAAGVPAAEGKIGPLTREVYLAGCAAADEVLVEADGARGRFVKLPAPHEPVIPENTGEILLVCNLKAAGLPLETAAHRPALVGQALQKGPQERLTADDVEALARRYLARLRQAWPGRPVRLVVRCDGTPEQQARARRMEREEWQ